MDAVSPPIVVASGDQSVRSETERFDQTTKQAAWLGCKHQLMKKKLLWSFSVSAGRDIFPEARHV